MRKEKCSAVLDGEDPIGSTPPFSFCRRLDTPLPSHNIHTFARPPISEALPLLPLAGRMFQYIRGEQAQKRDPIFDVNLAGPLAPPLPGPHSGVPLGGIGAGCVGRGMRGELRRFCLQPGMYSHSVRPQALSFIIRVHAVLSGTKTTNESNNLIDGLSNGDDGRTFARVLHVGPPGFSRSKMTPHASCSLRSHGIPYLHGVSSNTSNDNAKESGSGGNVEWYPSVLSDWVWGVEEERVTVNALFPRCWTTFEAAVPGIDVTIRQVSPFLPHDYGESSLPVSTFDISVTRRHPQDAVPMPDGKFELEDIPWGTTDELQVSIALLVENGYGLGEIPEPHSHFAGEPLLETSYMPPFECSSKEEKSSTNLSAIAALSSMPMKVDLATLPREQQDEITSEWLAHQPKITQDVQGILLPHLIPRRLHQDAVIETPTPEVAFDKGSIAVSTMVDAGEAYVTHCRHLITSVHESAMTRLSRFFQAGEKSAVKSARKQAKALWQHFVDTGDLPNDDESHRQLIASTLDSLSTSFLINSHPLTLGAMLCVRKTLCSFETKKSFRFSYSWDRPIARFGDGTALPKFYSRFFGTSGQSASLLAAYSLYRSKHWEENIVRWQQETWDQFHALQKELQVGRSDSQSETSEDLNTDGNGKESDFYHHMLFNELYFLVDGGSLWLDSTNGSANCGENHPSPRVFPALSLSTDPTKSSFPGQLGTLCSLNSPDPKLSASRSSYWLTPIPSQLLAAAEFTSLFFHFSSHNSHARVCGGNQSTVGQWLYFEGHEYLMYNTYDVHFYAGFALLQLWPQLEFSLQRDYTTSIPETDTTVRRLIAHGDKRPIKVANAVPHDLGSPADLPWKHLNSYCLQDVSQWKDLGPKCILQIYRNLIFLENSRNKRKKVVLSMTGASYLQKNKVDGEEFDFNSQMSRKYGGDGTKNENEQKELLAWMQAYVHEVYPLLHEVMTYLTQYIHDDMLENSGFPDQTYDIWIAQGVHAYCGGLWITANEAMIRIAQMCGRSDDAAQYQETVAKARVQYTNKLWNGTYLNYDSSSTTSHSNSIMADMLAGHWFALACDLPPLLSSTQIESCLATIYHHNVVEFGQGQWIGAVNGMRPPSANRPAMIDNACLQSREVWSGTTYGLAATMLSHAFYLSSRYKKASVVTSDQESTISQDIDASVEVSPNQYRQLYTMAMNTARGIHDGGWQRFGYWFATPEAWEQSGNFRSLGYMRPLSIWAIQYVAQQHS